MIIMEKKGFSYYLLCYFTYIILSGSPENLVRFKPHFKEEGTKAWRGELTQCHTANG